MTLPTVDWTLHINHDGENAPVDIPTGQSDGGNNLIDFLSSQVTLVCVKLTKRVTCDKIPALLACQCVHRPGSSPALQRPLFLLYKYDRLSDWI